MGVGEAIASGSGSSILFRSVGTLCGPVNTRDIAHPRCATRCAMRSSWRAIAGLLRLIVTKWIIEYRCAPSKCIISQMSSVSFWSQNRSIQTHLLLQLLRPNLQHPLICNSTCICPRNEPRGREQDRESTGTENRSMQEQQGVQTKHLFGRRIIYLPDAHRICPQRQKGWHEVL